MWKKTLKPRESNVIGTITFDRPLLLEESPSSLSVLKRRAKTTVLTLLGFVLICAAVLALWGKPYLRLDERLVDGKDGTDLKETEMAFTRYVSFGDARRVHAGEYGHGLPWLIFIPLNDVDSSNQGQSSFEDTPDHESTP